jgi:hypothetical protein
MPQPSLSTYLSHLPRQVLYQIAGNTAAAFECERADALSQLLSKFDGCATTSTQTISSLRRGRRRAARSRDDVRIVREWYSGNYAEKKDLAARLRCSTQHVESVVDKSRKWPELRAILSDN